MEVWAKIENLKIEWERLVNKETSLQAHLIEKEKVGLITSEDIKAWLRIHERMKTVSTELCQANSFIENEAEALKDRFW